jgi:hypothetical protein
MSAPARAPGAGLAWYRYFWPWFIVGLLGTTVVAGLVTVWIAFEYGDDVVRADYYESGKAINRRLGREQLARRLGISGRLTVESSSGVVGFVLRGPGAQGVESLELSLSHATHAGRDHTLALERVAPGRFASQWPEVIGSTGGRWYASLEPRWPGGNTPAALGWRLTRTLSLPASEPIDFGTSP